MPRGAEVFVCLPCSPAAPAYCPPSHPLLSHSLPSAPCSPAAPAYCPPPTPPTSLSLPPFCPPPPQIHERSGGGARNGASQQRACGAGEQQHLSGGGGRFICGHSNCGCGSGGRRRGERCAWCPQKSQKMPKSAKKCQNVGLMMMCKVPKKKGHL